jgi:serine/threonine-protein kinase
MTLSPLEAEYRRLLIERQYVTEEELRRCHYIQEGAEKAGKPVPDLLQLMLEQNFLSRSQARRIKRDAEDAVAGGAAPLRLPGYQLLDKLGQGGMSVVYKAVHLALERVVAVKVLPKKLATNRWVVDRFTQEARAAAKISHPNIIQAFDLGLEPSGYHYFVMEYVPGRTAAEELAEIGRYSEADALRIGIQIGRALAHAHAAGILHRDVKPQNIMVTPERTAKLMDLGLAVQTDESGAARRDGGFAVGTAYYASPEQIRGDRDVDFHTDVYALGATLYHMVTGIVPFEGGDPNEVVERQLNEALTPPYILHSDVSVETSNIIGKAMAKEADERFDSMDEMTDAMVSHMGSPAAGGK